MALISVSPLATPVTSPDASTVATAVWLDAQTNSAPATACPRTSVATASSRSVSPSNSVATAGDTATLLTRCLTVTVTCTAADPVTPEDVALICVSPLATPMTSPDASTVATEVALDAQTNSAPATACPRTSVATASNRSVSPSSNVAAAGDTATLLTRCLTVTAAEPDASPELAVIVAVPLPAAVTRPEASTVATAVSPESQENSAPGTAWPFSSNACADS